MPHILDLTFYRYGFENSKEIVKRYTISKTNKDYSTIVYEMGLSESHLTSITKPFSC